MASKVEHGGQQETVEKVCAAGVIG